MRMRLFQVFDLVSQGVVGPIIRERLDAPAVRSFRSVATDKATQIGQHPRDYVLLCLGEQEEDGSIVVAFDPPQTVVTGAVVCELDLQEA